MDDILFSWLAVHLIKKANFTHCGIIYTRDNSPRIAYQKR